MSLAITIYCGLPVRGFAFDGKLVLGDAETIGTVSGKITPSIFAGNFTIPPADGSGLPIKALVNAKGKFTFDRDGLASNSTATLFQVMTEQAQLLLRPDGSGRFDFDEGLNLAGLHASGSVEATFANRFKNLEVVASLMVEVDGLEMFGIARASVTTTIHDAESIRVQWSALGMSDSFVMTRDQNLRDELKKELLARLPKGIQNLWNAAKDLDLFNRNSALPLGLAGLDVFNKNTDAAKELSHLGDVKNDLIKSIPGVSEVSDGVKRWGDGASNFVNKVLWFDKNGGERMIPAGAAFRSPATRLALPNARSLPAHGPRGRRVDGKRRRNRGRSCAGIRHGSAAARFSRNADARSPRERVSSPDSKDRAHCQM